MASTHPHGCSTVRTCRAPALPLPLPRAPTAETQDQGKQRAGKWGTQLRFIRKGVNRVAPTGAAPPLPSAPPSPAPPNPGCSASQGAASRGRTAGSPSPGCSPPQLPERFIALKIKKALISAPVSPHPPQPRPLTLPRAAPPSPTTTTTNAHHPSQAVPPAWPRTRGPGGHPATT